MPRPRCPGDRRAASRRRCLSAGPEAHRRGTPGPAPAPRRTLYRRFREVVHLPRTRPRRDRAAARPGRRLHHVRRRRHLGHRLDGDGRLLRALPHDGPRAPRPRERPAQRRDLRGVPRRAPASTAGSRRRSTAPASSSRSSSGPSRSRSRRRITTACRPRPRPASAATAWTAWERPSSSPGPSSPRTRRTPASSRAC